MNNIKWNKTEPPMDRWILGKWNLFHNNIFKCKYHPSGYWKMKHEVEGTVFAVSKPDGWREIENGKK